MGHLIRTLSPDVALCRRQLLVPGRKGLAPFLKESVKGKRRLWMEVNNLQRLSHGCPVSRPRALLLLCGGVGLGSRVPFRRAGVCAPERKPETPGCPSEYVLHF